MRCSKTIDLFEDQAELAPQGASDNDKRLKAELNDLERIAVGKAEKLKLTREGYECQWDDLLPVLDQIQKLLSQRGANRDRRNPERLPSWTQWWSRFRCSLHLEVGFRRVQKKLKVYRDKWKGNKPAAPASAQQRRAREFSKALAREITKAGTEGRNLPEALATFLRTNLRSRELDQLVRQLTSAPFVPARAGDGMADARKPLKRSS